jgi:hypothetical protein
MFQMKRYVTLWGSAIEQLWALEQRQPGRRDIIYVTDPDPYLGRHHTEFTGRY